MDPQAAVDRLLRIFRLDTTVFQDARDDSTFTIPAIVIAAVSFLLSGLGGWLWWVVESFGDKGKVFWQSALLGSLFALVLWIVWVGVAFVLLVNVFHYQANFERMLRACSFATVPLVISFFVFIPGVNLGVAIAAIGLMFLLMDIAVQVSVEAEPGHVILATFVGFAVFACVLAPLVGKDYYFAPNAFLFRAPATGLSDAASLAKSFDSNLPGLQNINSVNRATQCNAAKQAGVSLPGC